MTIDSIRMVVLILTILLVVVQHVLTLREEKEKKLENSKLSTKIEGIEQSIKILVSQGKITTDVARQILYTILWKITVFDEANHPVEGAAVEILNEVHKSFTSLAGASTDARGETSLVTTDASGGKFHITIRKDGYETYSRPLESSLVRVHLKRQS
jgi:hypothetical protein